MRQIKYLENGEGKLFEIEDSIQGVTEFNQNLLSKNTENLKSFSVKSKGKNIHVNLENGDITIDGNIIDLNLDEKTKAKLNIKNLRWINFHRKAISYRMAGLTSTKSVGYGVGWQSEIDGKNIKRYSLITDEGFTLEVDG